jgi:DNA-binding NtrC family response regulator
VSGEAVDKRSERTSDPFRVMVIDDDPGVRDYMEALVSRQGYRVYAAADGEQALARLDDVRPDLVTLDVVLPGMDGLETLRRIKQRMPEVPVVMLSGHGQARNIVEAMRLGASDFLRKPFEVEELELAFQKALEKRALKQEVERLRGRARSETELLLLFRCATSSSRSRIPTSPCSCAARAAPARSSLRARSSSSPAAAIAPS